MAITFERVVLPRDRSRVTSLLCDNEWPFHLVPRFTPGAAELIDVASPQTRAFWIRLDGAAVGIVRLLDLDDVDVGSAQFDLRIASTHRNRGIGRGVVGWLTTYLFDAFPALHRIEAATRVDNAPMRQVLEISGYVLEGRLRETWPAIDGRRLDTAIYGILRNEAAIR